MTRYSASQAYPSTLSAFRNLVLLCVVYSMGLGGTALWISNSTAMTRAALGTAWVVLTFVFMNMMLSVFSRQPYPSTLSVFWYLISFPRSYMVRVAATLAILLCVVYSMGLGGIALWISSSTASFFGSEWSPYALSPMARIALGTAWVVFFTFVFMNMMLSIFLRQPPFPSLLQLLRSHRELRDDQVYAVMDDWLDTLTASSRPAAAGGTRITGQVDAG